VTDYPCDKFGDFSFSCFGFIVRTNSLTSRHTYRITDAAKRFTPATVVEELLYKYVTIAPQS